MTPLEEETLIPLAQRMLADYDSNNPGTIFSEGFRLNVSDAWRLQAAVADLREARGEIIVGFKIGAVCKGNQKLIGLEHPAWGRLWESEQHRDGAMLDRKKFANPSMEAEFGIILSRDIEPTEASLDHILDSIASVHPVIEIHNFVFRGEAPHGAELLANNAIHAGVIRGESVIDPRDDVTTDLKLVYDGKTVDSWDSTKWPDDYLSAIEWLAQEQANIGKKLEQGNLILTGALGPPIPIEDTTLVELQSSRLGNVSAKFL